ncbi:hypothetical protein [Spongiibacter marinus]|uniref:hypothetical protein n=1 Tax=Spongiibacter marinus TaxID=354246 RepID=UPI0035660EA8
MEEKENKVEITPHSPVVDQGEPVEIQAMGKFFEGIIAPLAKSQEIAAIEGTKRAEILAKIAHKGLLYFFCVAFSILAISVLALYLGKDQLAEKIIFGVISFIGGLGIGRSMPKNG